MSDVLTFDKLDKQEQREYAAKVSEDYESTGGSPLPRKSRRLSFANSETPS